MSSTMAQVVGGLLLTAAILGALAGIGKILMLLVNLGRKANRVFDDYLGEPPRPGFPNGRPGVLDRMSSIETMQTSTTDAVTAVEKRLAAVEAQMVSNEGGSLRDAIERTAVAVGAAVDHSHPLPSPPPPDGVVADPLLRLSAT